MSKKEMPSWIMQSRGYRLLIEAAESAFEGSCDCHCCELVREWAKTATPPEKPTIPESVKRGR